MSIEIVGSFDQNKLYCAGSFTKFLTTFVSLSLLSEKYALNKIIDDDNFFDEICINSEAKNFLKLFQKMIGGKFSLHDVCSFYTGLPYTYDPTEAELESADAGLPFKHHSILEEKTFLSICENKISPIYGNRSKFHYSEISIIFLGYLIEKIYRVTIESLFHHYVINKFNLTRSQFSRARPTDVFTQDLSDKYDYPSIAILDHGYFCYSNGYYTTLNDMKTLIENLLDQPVFRLMTDINIARAASNTIMNGLTVELRLVADDLIYGYEGLSYSGCNIWAYSTKFKKGYLTFCNDEEEAYPIIYDNFGYSTFDKAPEHTQKYYRQFIQHYNYDYESKDIPVEYQGDYQRVKINEKKLAEIFVLGNNFMVIRNPDRIKYELTCLNQRYFVKGRDRIQDAEVKLYQVKSGNRYMFYDGTLYRKI